MYGLTKSSVADGSFYLSLNRLSHHYDAFSLFYFGAEVLLIVGVVIPICKSLVVKK